MSNTKRLGLDAALLVLLVIAFVPKATGIAIHEWLSLALAGGLLVHMVVNWEWVLKVSARFFDRLRTASRINLLIDASTFLSAVTVMVSGLAISQVVLAASGAATAPGATWYMLHSLSARTTMLLSLVHVALHWRWIVSTTRRAWNGSPGSFSTPEMVPIRIDGASLPGSAEER